MSDKAKRAPATFECAECNYWCYTGKSKDSFAKLKEEFPKEKLKMERIDIDHKSPVLDVKTGFTDWNDLINGMFCSEDNLWALCKTCHDKKTAKEREERKKWKKKKKS